MTAEDLDDIELILGDRELDEFVEVKKNMKYVIGDIDQSALDDDWEDKVPDMLDYNNTKAKRNKSTNK